MSTEIIVADSTDFNGGQPVSTNNPMPVRIVGGGAGGSTPGAALDGTDGSGITNPNGGVGIRGWLSNILAGIGTPTDAPWAVTGAMTLVSGLKTLTNKVVSGVLSVTINGTLPAGTNFLGYFSLPVTTYAKAANASALVVKSAAGSFTVASVLSTTAGYLLAIDATAAPASGAAVTPIVPPWNVVASQTLTVSYTDAPIPVASGLVLLVSSSPTTYTPISAISLQGGAR